MFALLLLAPRPAPAILPWPQCSVPPSMTHPAAVYISVITSSIRHATKKKTEHLSSLVDYCTAVRGRSACLFFWLGILSHSQQRHGSCLGKVYKAFGVSLV